MRSPTFTLEISSDWRARGQHLGVLLCALALCLGCKRGDGAGESASAVASEEPPMFESATPSAPSAPALEVLVDAGSDAPPRVVRRGPEPPPLVPPPRTVDPKSVAGRFDDYGFPMLAAVEHLCGRREYPSHGVHLTWDAFATDVSPGELVKLYQKRIGKQGFTADGAGGSWRIPPDAPIHRTLTISAVGASGPHRSCPAKPGPGAKSVIVLSRR